MMIIVVVVEEEEEEGANLDMRNIVAGSNAKYGWSCS
jgi:hypothetical protein